MNRILLATAVVLVGHTLSLLSNATTSHADSLTIGKIPAHRTVKTAFAVKINENFPRTTSMISNGVSISSSDAGVVVLPALTQTIYQTPLPPTVITVPNGGTTRDPKPSLGGASDPNTTVEVYLGDALFGTTTTDGAGNWVFTPTQALTYGYHTLKIRAVSTTSGAGEFTQTIQIKVDCPVGLYGPTCSSTCPGGQGENACSGHGTCSDGLDGDGRCVCESGRFDFACSTASDVCQVDAADGLNKESEWGAVEAILNTPNNVEGRPYYWNDTTWTTTEPRSYRFTTKPREWFAVSGTKSCLGYQDSKQVLYLLLTSHFPTGTYYDPHKATNYRFGLGPLSNAGVPNTRSANLVWKLMPTGGGSLFYIVAALSYESGDTYTVSPIRSLNLYRESSSPSVAPKEFAKQNFDPNQDVLVASLDLPANTAKRASSEDPAVPAVEVAVDLLKLFSATGWTTTTPLRVQVITQAVKSEPTGQLTVDGIDKTKGESISGFITRNALEAPTVRVSNKSERHVTFRCQVPKEMKAIKYVFQVTKYASGEPDFYVSDERTLVRRLRKSTYKASCYYETKDDRRSPLSQGQRFKVE